MLKNPKNELQGQMFGDKPPILPFGKYAGIAMDKLPNSYLRWMLTQKFDSKYTYWAKKKLSESNEPSDFSINISRHAYDSFSFRFLDKWVNRSDEYRKPKDIGFGSFVAMKAKEALEKGECIREKKRHVDDGKVYLLDGMKFVFSDEEIEIPTLITVMD